jgi:hypothetical protein
VQCGFFLPLLWVALLAAAVCVGGSTTYEWSPSASSQLHAAASASAGALLVYLAVGLVMGLTLLYSA